MHCRYSQGSSIDPQRRSRSKTFHENAAQRGLLGEGQKARLTKRRFGDGARHPTEVSFEMIFLRVFMRVSGF